MPRWIGLIVIGLSTPYLVAQEPAVSPDHTAKADLPVNALHAMRQVIPEITLDEAPLADVLNDLARRMNVNLIVRWRWLEAVGLERDTAVTLSLKNVTYGDAMLMILDAAALGDDELALRVSPEKILVSTLEDINSEVVVRVYDVRDLTHQEVEPSLAVASEITYVASIQPVVDDNAVAPQPVIGRLPIGVFLGDDQDFSLDPNDPLFQDRDDDDDDDERQPGDPGTIEQLIEVIVNTVEPASWRINGGEGTVVPFKGQLVVRNSIYVHQLLAGSLGGSAAVRTSHR